MIQRILHIIAIGALMSSALYAYSIKYETTYQAEQIVKLKARMQRERDAIAVLRAEWQHLNNPERLQELAAKHLDLGPLKIPQLGTIAELPMKQDKGDEIGRKLEALGLAEPTATPKDITGSVTQARTPGGGGTPR